MIKTCPTCNTKPDVNNGYINCVNPKCNDSGLVYLTGEWSALPRDLDKLSKLEQEYIDDDPKRDRGISS